MAVGDGMETRGRSVVKAVVWNVIGLVSMSVAIAGSDVAMTVESICSMNSATARINGRMRPDPAGCVGDDGAGEAALISLKSVSIM